MKNSEILHGAFMNIFGVGTQITGAPGIGKSELALALMYRNHQLISDDAPIFHIDKGVIVGSPQLLPQFISIRGIGIINIVAILGPSVLKKDHELSIIINLENKDVSTNENASVEGLHNTRVLLGHLIPVVTIPIISPRNLDVLVETIVKNYLLKVNKGYHPVSELETLLQNKMGQPTK